MMFQNPFRYPLGFAASQALGLQDDFPDAEFLWKREASKTMLPVPLLEGIQRNPSDKFATANTNVGEKW